MIVRMWEVVAARGRADDLVDWVLSATDSAAAVYRSADERVVVIDPGGGDPGIPPPELVARPPHAWDFDRVVRPSRPEAT